MTVSYSSLTDKVFVTSVYLNYIENGSRSPSLELLIAIANALSVSADDILIDNITHSESNVNKEINDLLLDCNPDEKEMLTRTLKFLKALFSEFGI